MPNVASNLFKPLASSGGSYKNWVSGFSTQKPPTNTATPYNASVIPSVPKTTTPSTTPIQTGFVNTPIKTAPSAPPVSASAAKVQADPLISGLGTAKTPEQIALETGQTKVPIYPSQTDSHTTSFPGLVGLSVRSAQGSMPIGQSAADIGKTYGDEIAKIGRIGSATVAGNLSTGTKPIGEGNAAIAANAASNRITALSQAENAALAGTGQQLTAQNQATTGTIGAASLLQPSASFPFVFNPGTGTFSTPGTSGTTTQGGPTLTYNPQVDAQNLAQAVMNRQISYNDALNALGYGSNSSNAAGQLSSAVLALGGNPTNLQAQASGAASIVQNIPQLQAANTAADGIEKTITAFLSQNPDLNPSDLALSNSVQQWLQGVQITDPRYQSLFNYLSEYTNTLAPILGVGGNPTNLKTEIAQSFLNPLASSSSITSVLKNISQLAKDKVQNLSSGATGGGVVAGGTSPGTPGSIGSISWEDLGG